MKFAFLGYSQEKNWNAMSKAEQDAMLEDCFTYDSKLIKEGHFGGEGTALQPSRTAKTLRWHKGQVIVTDGPYAETKEQLGGVGILEADDMGHAVELVSKHPGLHYGATFEIRPIDEQSLQRQADLARSIAPSAPAADPQSVRFASLGYLDENGWGSISEDEARRCSRVASPSTRLASKTGNGGVASGLSPRAPRRPCGPKRARSSSRTARSPRPRNFWAELSSWRSKT